MAITERSFFPNSRIEAFEIAEKIFEQLDVQTLRNSTLVSRLWNFFLTKTTSAVIITKLSLQVKKYQTGLIEDRPFFNPDYKEIVKFVSLVSVSSKDYFFVKQTRDSIGCEREFVLIFSKNENEKVNFENNLIFPNSRKSIKITALKASKQTNHCSVLVKNAFENSIYKLAVNVNKEGRIELQSETVCSNNLVQSFFDIYLNRICYVKINNNNFEVCLENINEPLIVEKEIKQLKILEETKQLVILTDAATLNFYTIDNSTLTFTSSFDWKWSYNDSFTVLKDWLFVFVHEKHRLHALHTKSFKEDIVSFDKDIALISMQDQANFVFLVTSDTQRVSLSCVSMTDIDIFSVKMPELPKEFLSTQPQFCNIVISDLNSFLFLANQKCLFTHLISKQSDTKQIVLANKEKSLNHQNKKKWEKAYKLGMTLVKNYNFGKKKS